MLAHCQPKQKETRMIDLSKAKVGDEFEYFGEIAKLAYAHELKTRFVLETKCGVIVCNEKGEGCTSDPFQLIKHEPRHWLKDLPSADLFNCAWLACEKNDGWYSFDREPLVNPNPCSYFGIDKACHLKHLFMPILTGDEWEFSKISIPDLKAWQLINKESK